MSGLIQENKSGASYMHACVWISPAQSHLKQPAEVWLPRIETWEPKTNKNHTKDLWIPRVHCGLVENETQYRGLLANSLEVSICGAWHSIVVVGGGGFQAMTWCAIDADAMPVNSTPSIHLTFHLIPIYPLEWGISTPEPQFPCLKELRSRSKNGLHRVTT